MSINYYYYSESYYRQACMQCSHAGIVLLSGPKMVFRPTVATHCPYKREIWHVYQGRNVGIQLPKLAKFAILAINLPLRGNSFALFLRISQYL